MLVAHNARFDLGFLDREVERLTGRRIAAPGRRHGLARAPAARGPDAARRARLARALLRHRDAAVPPCAPRRRGDRRDPARAARARAGARRDDGRRPRRARGAAGAAARREALARGGRAAAARRLPLPRPQRPGALRRPRPRPARRLRSYFRTERQRPAVEAALGALERIEWRVLGSELEAALEELRLLRELRPPANARSTRPDRHVYLRRRGAGWCVTDAPGPYGPLKSRRARPPRPAALDGWEGSPRRRCRRSAPSCGGSRPTSASRTRRGCATGSPALEEVVAALAELERLRALELCLLVPAARGGLPARLLRHRRPRRGRALAPGRRARVESSRRAWPPPPAPTPSLRPADADELLLIGSFLRRRRRPSSEVVPAGARPSAALRSLGPMSSVATATFADRLADAVERKRSQLVVGLDPRLELLPVELRGEAVGGRAEAAHAYARFCCGIVDAVAPYVVAVKPQVAFFEALGADGSRRFRAGLRLRARRRPARDRGREARRHRLHGARLRDRVSRAARGRSRRSRTR